MEMIGKDMWDFPARKNKALLCILMWIVTNCLQNMNSFSWQGFSQFFPAGCCTTSETSIPRAKDSVWS